MLNYMKILLGLLSIFVIFTILSSSFGNRFSLNKEGIPISKEIKVYKEEDVQLLIKYLDSKHTTNKASGITPVTPLNKVINSCLDKKQNTINYLEKYVGERKCPSLSYKKWTPGEPQVDMRILSVKAPNNTHSIPITRGNVYHKPQY